MADNMTHPDEATWERLATGELGAAERAEAFDHITGCERCSQIWRGLLMLQSEAQAQGLIPRATPARTGWQRSPVFALALAATLVVVIGGIMLSRRTADDPNQLRGSAAAAVEQLTATNGADSVPTFAWTPTPGATRYRIDVFTIDGRPQWTREVDAPPVRWPADEPRTVGSYRWRVEALNSGAVLARSRLTEIEVAR